MGKDNLHVTGPCSVTLSFRISITVRAYWCGFLPPLLKPALSHEYWPPILWQVFQPWCGSVQEELGIATLLQYQQLGSDVLLPLMPACFMQPLVSAGSVEAKSLVRAVLFVSFTRTTLDWEASLLLVVLHWLCQSSLSWHLHLFLH